MAENKRFQILQAFFNVVNGCVPPDDGQWRKVDMKPILRIQPQECPAFYVFDFQEKVIEESKQRNELVRATLYIIFEFWVHHTLSDNPSEKMNKILWEVQQQLAGSDLGGLAQAVTEIGSKFKVESAEQRVVSAEVAYSVTYVRKTSVIPSS